MATTFSNNKRVLITGANGTVGRHLVRFLATRGFCPVQAVRSAQSEVTAGYPVLVTGDLSAQETSELDLTTCGKIHAVVHLAGVSSHASEELLATNIVGTRQLANAAGVAGIERFVFVSTALVHEIGKITDRESGQAVPLTPYAQSKLGAERALLEGKHTFDVIIVRSPPILHRKATGSIGLLMKALALGIPLPFGSVTENRIDFVSIGVLCDFLATCIMHPAAAGKTFNVSDGMPLSTRELLERLAAMTGQRTRMVSIPVPVLRKLLGVVSARLASRLLGDSLLDISLAANALGWSPAIEHCISAMNHPFSGPLSHAKKGNWD